MSSYWWGIFKSKNEKLKIKNFIQSFEHIKNKEEYAKIFQNMPVSLETMTLLALNYTKSGDFDKSIAIYLNALEYVKTKEQKIELFVLLGKAYYLAGFLQRAKGIFLDAVKLQPRNIEALSYLVSIFEKLFEYDSALEAIDALKEMDKEIEDQKILLESKKMIFNKQNLPLDELTKKLFDFAKKNRVAQRIFIEYALKNQIPLEYKSIKDFDFGRLMDIVWYSNHASFPDELIQTNTLVEEVLSAKGVLDTKESSSIFELDVMIKLKGKKDDIDLSFEYICESCKSRFAIHFYTCPRCMHCGSATIEPTLIHNESHNYNFMV